MKRISQGGTSYINVGVHDTPTEAGLIQTSQAARVTEIAALSGGTIERDNGKDYIVDRPPAPDGDYRWCSGCNQWVKPGGFGKDASSADGKDHYCRTCRKEQERRWLFTRAFKKIVPKTFQKG